MSTSSAGGGACSTSVGAGGGRRPGHGAPATAVAVVVNSGLPQGTSTDWPAGSRPPCTRPMSTASIPRRSCTRTNARAARASASDAPPKKPGWAGGGGASFGRSGSSPRATRRRRTMARSRNPGNSPLSPRATAWHAAASAPKRSETLAAGRAANCPSVVIPSRCRVTARSGRASMATDQGARKSAVPPAGMISDARASGAARAASSAAKSPSAMPAVASSPDSRTAWSRRTTNASSPPKKRAGPREGRAHTPRRTAWAHGHSSVARSTTRAKRRASSPRAPSSRSS